MALPEFPAQDNEVLKKKEMLHYLLIQTNRKRAGYCDAHHLSCIFSLHSIPQPQQPHLHSQNSGTAFHLGTACLCTATVCPLAQGISPLCHKMFITVIEHSFGSPFSVVCGHCLVILSFTINQTLKWLSMLPILLMQESFWC